LQKYSDWLVELGLRDRENWVRFREPLAIDPDLLGSPVLYSFDDVETESSLTAFEIVP